MMKTKICTKCNKSYPATPGYFPSHKETKDKLSPWCRGCHRKLAKKWYQQYSKKSKKCQEQYRNTIKGHLRHVYADIRHRCNNPNATGYKNYGGRGIRCLFTSDEFIDYVINDLQVDPRGLQIDRINNNGHYEKGNIRFVTRKVNNNNKRSKNSK